MLEIDRVIARTPCLAIELPRDDRREEMRFLDAHQIELLADAIDERYHALIYMAAYTGAWCAELAGLRVEACQPAPGHARDLGDARGGERPSDHPGNQDGLSTNGHDAGSLPR